MKVSFGSRILEAMQKNNGTMELKDIYNAMGSAEGKSDDAEFKRKIRRGLYHLKHAGKIRHTGPSTYSVR